MAQPATHSSQRPPTHQASYLFQKTTWYSASRIHHRVDGSPFLRASHIFNRAENLHADAESLVLTRFSSRMQLFAARAGARKDTAPMVDVQDQWGWS
ncbi:heterokaryon incompatibility protein [Colletotrichum scovillei]|uniref:Heterokaryon incompatibility protein n=1 Tax=Colletotrichum scovillei TaxID=1209932 RepID=A0A9P7U4H0_9PEZI|nr:heterokaryon incompatibility protein [Colletotrichum scovillei]KAG7041621.1 heterokaryon incompatibility protein [Colletotrichum scovillei]KAG7061648.1 heterokaryon incompatibility protein [Colletotrichum scovillei]